MYYLTVAELSYAITKAFYNNLSLSRALLIAMITQCVRVPHVNLKHTRIVEQSVIFRELTNELKKNKYFRLLQ